MLLSPFIEQKKLNDRFFWLKQRYAYTANILVYEGETNLLLVDTGFDGIAPMFVQYLQNTFKKSVAVVIHTHVHGDHIGANKLLRSPVTYYLHENGKKLFNSPGNKYYISVVREIFFDKEIIHLIPMHGGHSSTDLVIVFPGQKIDCTGDLYLSESFPLVNIYDQCSVYILLERLEFLYQKYKYGYEFFPGHGKMTSASELAEYIYMVRKTIDIVERLKQQGLQLMEIIARRPLAGFEKWGKFLRFVNEKSWITHIFRSS